MSPNEHFTYKEERGFFQRYGLALGLTVLVAGGGVFVRQVFSGHGSAPPSRAEMVTITPLPAPSPPPPPPPPPTPATPSTETPKEQMMDQPMIAQEESKPVDAPAPEAGLGTNNTGTGGPDYGLSRNGNGVIGGTGTSKGGGGSRYGWYAAQVQQVISDALRGHAKTRNASFSAIVRIWADTTGQVTQAKLAQSTGDAALDRALANEILPNLKLLEPPPPGLRMPFVTRLSARRPN